MTNKDFNETSTTAAQMNTPLDQDHGAATDMLSEFVEQTMDNIEHLVDEDATEK